LVALIAFSRVFIGVHFGTDIVGGLLLGLFWLLVGLALSEWRMAARPILLSGRLQEATSRSVAGGASASTPMTTSANGVATGRASRTGAVPGENQILAAIPEQRVVRSAFLPAVAGSAATQRSTRAPLRMRAEGDRHDPGTVNQVRHGPPQAVLSLDLGRVDKAHERDSPGAARCDSTLIFMREIS